MALVIAGERSGVGKTTVTLALLSFLSQQREKVQSFKVGPDYIDPMFHAAITNRPCRNLDPVLTSEAYVQQCFTRHCQGVNYALIEGVMGLFDGISIQKNQERTTSQGKNPSPYPKSHNLTWWESQFSSTAHIARLLNLPVLLVIDCSRLSGSVAAIAHGYRSFDPHVKIAGVVLNRVGSDRHRELLKDALEPLDLEVLGVLPRQDKIAIPDRHLGLVPTAEISQLEAIFDRLAQQGKECFNWRRLLPLLKVEERGKVHQVLCIGSRKARIAIARDRAFNFYYQDNLDLLQQFGAELVFWSPMEERSLPEGVRGLYLGGGFPEVFAQQLAKNKNAHEAIRVAIHAGMPTYAECGGLMYLCEQIVDFEGKSWQMVGILPTTAVMGKRLTLGYRQATVLEDSLLLNAEETVWGHEFHRSQLCLAPTSPLFKARGYKRQSSVSLEGWRQNLLHASYIHLHWGIYPEIPQRFIQHCLRFFG